MSLPTSHPDSSYYLRDRLWARLDRDRTLNDLANETGATDARVLWHLQRMAEEDLVETTQGGTYWHRRSNAIPPQAHETITPAFPAHIAEDFEDALREISDGLYGDNAIQASGEHRARLSPLQAADFRDRLLALIAEFFAPGMGDKSGVKYGFHWILTPIDLHPLAKPEQMVAVHQHGAESIRQPGLERPPPMKDK